VLVGISTKAYLSRGRTLDWLGEVADLARGHAAVRDGAVELVVAPSTPLLEAAVRVLDGTGVRVMAQDVSRFSGGAVTGEDVASLLADVGVAYVEVGHAERRSLLGETDAVIAEKVERSREAGLVPWLCVGEEARVGPEEAARSCLEQVVAAAGSGPLVVAHEPVWAIGADEPAPVDHVVGVARALRAGLPEAVGDARLVYGGSAGPGLLELTSPSVDGLFLGRRAHDVAAVASVLDEAARTSGRPADPSSRPVR
jgi:triosephosphate isomerase